MNKTLKAITGIVVIPLIISLLGTVLLAASSLIPTEWIQTNSENSYNQLSLEKDWDYAFNVNEPSYEIDNYTDAQYLMTSYYMSSDNISSVLLNNRHLAEGDEGKIKSFGEAVNGAEGENVYPHYWLGFRIFVRPLLTVASYYVIRKATAALFFGLAFAVLILLGRKNIPLAAGFGITMIAVNPAVISHSLQFSNCFILAFIFLIFTILKPKKSGFAAFMVFGALTQFFDFYTSPLVTLGFPLLFLIATEKLNIRDTLKRIGGWLWGYVSLWFIKMVFTTLFTDVNGFEDSLGSFMRRWWLSGEAEMSTEKYNPVKALYKVAQTADVKIVALFVLLFAVGFVTLTVCKKSRNISQAVSILIVAALPIIWFSAASQPTVIHAWFQYRTIAVAYFAAAVCCAVIAQQIISRKKGRFECSENDDSGSENG